MQNYYNNSEHDMTQKSMHVVSMYYKYVHKHNLL